MKSFLSATFLGMALLGIAAVIGCGPNQGGAAPGGNAPAPSSAEKEEVPVTIMVSERIKERPLHDKIELIINESSLASSTQKASNNKKFEWASELSQFPSIAGLLAQLELRNGIGSPTPKIGIKNDDKFTADGKYERSDRFTARISGLVVDVKPNGHLVIEAKESIQNDGEIKTMVIAGVIDPKDITKANTVQSSQLANLVIKVENSGQVKDSTTKGLIPRIFETIFNF